MTVICSEKHEHMRKRSACVADECFVVCSANHHFRHTKLFMRWVLYYMMGSILYREITIM